MTAIIPVDFQVHDTILDPESGRKNNADIQDSYPLETTLRSFFNVRAADHELQFVPYSRELAEKFQAKDCQNIFTSTWAAQKAQEQFFLVVRRKLGQGNLMNLALLIRYTQIGQ